MQHITSDLHQYISIIHLQYLALMFINVNGINLRNQCPFTLWQNMFCQAIVCMVDVFIKSCNSNMRL